MALDPVPTQLAATEIALAVDIQGINIVNQGEALPVTIVSGGSGTNAVEITTIVAAEAIRDGATKQVNFPDITKYVRYNIYVTNSLDQVVRLAPFYLSAIVLEDETLAKWEITSADTNYCYEIPSNPGSVWLNELLPKCTGTATKKAKNISYFDTRFNDHAVAPFKLAYRANAIPTSGSLTVKFIGFLR